MKFTVTLKDPDGFYDGIHDAVDASIRAMPDDEREAIREVRVKKTKEAIGLFVEYGEYVDIEFDTEAKTARVVPRSESK